jgi:hypothetical protein
MSGVVTCGRTAEPWLAFASSRSGAFARASVSAVAGRRGAGYAIPRNWPANLPFASAGEGSHTRRGLRRCHRCLTTRWSGPVGNVAASCSQWIACSPKRKRSGGGPLNSVVSQHVKASRIRLGVVGILGLLAPLWWGWTVSQITYALYIASGSPERPTHGLMWGTIYAPQFAFGFLAGLIVTAIAADSPIRGWITFIGSVFIGSLAIAVVFGSPAKYLESLFSTFGHWFFFGGSAIWPLVARNRRRAG